MSESIVGRREQGRDAAGSEESRNTGEALLARGRALGLFSALDVELARRLARLYGETRPGVLWALALVCRQEAAGHVCADLSRLGAEGLRGEREGQGASAKEDAPLRTEDLLGESPEDWIRTLETSPLIARAEHVDEAPPRPFVLDRAGRLYLRRSFEDQRRLAQLVRRRVAAPDLVAAAGMEPGAVAPGSGAETDSSAIAARIARLAPEEGRGWQATREALRRGLARPLLIVTGGPGTGKTTLVVRLLALLVEQATREGRAPPSIRLLAPTGKAAAAMSAALVRGRDQLELDPAVRAAIPTAAETLHRALYRQTRRDAFGRPESLALAEDVVVVDEASMVDLALMRRLFEAGQQVGRLVLLGDPDQLASVDSGAVLAELCRPAVDSAETTRPAGAAGLPGLADSVVTLRESHRFAAGGAIGRLAEAIRVGDADAMLALLEDPSLPAIERCEVESVEAVRARLADASLEAQRAIAGAIEPGAKLARTGDYRVLCAHRRGPLGVESLCAVLDEALAFERRTSRRSGWWRGRLLLVTRNAPDQDLWNGDVGLVEETASGLRALFPDAAGGVRLLSPGRLPAHESAIAMSIHKSQGSEFETVDLVLGGRVSPLMTRELLYTGVTRARERLRIHASTEVLREAVARRVQRDSGLAELLAASAEGV
jgi:exodeoxyribonuclease V alpha subunit